ncbi:hypothetical protein VXE65_19355 [Mycolicibacterium conceptionense]|uniref:hypothetical protein n=1 Tax=Mycolicibacterium conceptionense TaxID=451644 RepID=UPI003204C4F7
MTGKQGRKTIERQEMTDTQGGPVVLAAEQVRIMAVGNGAAWRDVVINFFIDWKIMASIIAVVVIVSAGIVMLGKMRMVGLFMIILIAPVVGAVILNIEKLVGVSQNSVDDYQRPAPVSNPFGRG